MTGEALHRFQRKLHHQLPAPMVKVLNDTFGIESGFMSTIHATQTTSASLDLPHEELRRRPCRGPEHRSGSHR